jgi:predicted dehydrogenase
MTRVALVGCGRWGRNILRDLLALGVEVSVADPDPAARSHSGEGGPRPTEIDHFSATVTLAGDDTPPIEKLTGTLPVPAFAGTTALICSTPLTS